MSYTVDIGETPPEVVENNTTSESDFAYGVPDPDTNTEETNNAEDKGKEEEKFSDSDDDDEDKKEEASLDWNIRFQNCLEMPESPLKYHTLAALSKEFTSTTEVYGRIIISEIFLPGEKKTIRPSDIGGYAGGMKYTCQGILYKFAIDIENKGDKGTFFYGNKERDDEKAMKGATNELKGLMCYESCKLKELCFPLFTLIQYRGYCLSAMPLLPLKEMIYGSSDGGKSCHADNEHLNSLMEKAGKILGLRGHLVCGKVIYGPGDIEGHLGKDNRYYVLDFGRVMPPQANIYNVYPLSSVWYNHFRPSYVMNWKSQMGLCSDAGTNWCFNDPDKTQIASDVQLATKTLYEQTIPEFAAQLVGTIEPLTPQSLVTSLHEAGINIRCLGYIRQALESLKESNEFQVNSLQQIVLTEALARTIKNEYRNHIRKAMQTIKSPVDECYITPTIEFLKPIFFVWESPTNFKVPKEMEPYFKFQKQEKIVNEKSFWSYTLETNHDLPNGIATVQSNHPISASQSTFYMEIRLVKGNCGIGLISEDVSTTIREELDKTTGEMVHTVEVNDASKKVKNNIMSVHINDVIGLFFSREKEIMCWIKNGEPIGSNPISRHVQYYPSVGITVGSIIEYNFGYKEFTLDVNNFCSALSISPPENYTSLEDSSSNFWNSSIYSAVASRFPQLLSKQKDTEVRNLIDVETLFKRVAELSYLKFSERVSQALWNKALILLPQDLLAMNSRVRHTGMVDFATGVSCIYEAQQKQNESSKAKELLQNAIRLIRNAINVSPVKQPDYYMYLGDAYAQIQSFSEASAAFKMAIVECKKRLEREKDDIEDLNQYPIFITLRQTLHKYSNLVFQEVGSALLKKKWSRLFVKDHEALFQNYKALLVELVGIDGSDLIQSDLDILNLRVGFLKDLSSMILIFLKVKVIYEIINTPQFMCNFLTVILKTLSLFEHADGYWDAESYMIRQAGNALWDELITNHPQQLYTLLSKTFDCPIHGNELAAIIDIGFLRDNSKINAGEIKMTRISVSAGTALMKNSLEDLVSSTQFNTFTDYQKTLFTQTLATVAVSLGDNREVVGHYLQLKLSPPLLTSPRTSKKTFTAPHATSSPNIHFPGFSTSTSSESIKQPKRRGLAMPMEEGFGIMEGASFSPLPPDPSFAPLPPSPSLGPAFGTANFAIRPSNEIPKGKAFSICGIQESVPTAKPKLAPEKQTYIAKHNRICTLKEIECPRNDLPDNIKIWKSLHHNNICELFEINKAPPALANLVFEASYPPLDSQFNQLSNLRIHSISLIAKQLLHVTEYLHSMKIIHMTLNSVGYNITNNQIKLSDFTSALQLEESKSLTKYTSIALQYSAPEVLQKDCSFNQSADIWTIGAVLYRLFYLTDIVKEGSNITEAHQQALQFANNPTFPPLHPNFQNPNLIQQFLLQFLTLQDNRATPQLALNHKLIVS